MAAVLRAAEAMGGATGSPIAPVERANYERMLEELCGRMDEADFAWAKGRAMALVDWTKVVDFALGE